MSVALQKQPLSDSEDDEDYVPPVEEQGSDSEYSDTNDEKPSNVENEPVDEAERKRTRDALWSTFQESVKGKDSAPERQQESKLVKIERRRLFAGKEVVEVVEVPEDSPEAKMWPLWVNPSSKADIPQSLSTPSAGAEAEKSVLLEVSTSQAGSSGVDTALEDASQSHTSPPSDPKPPPKRPGPRKPKVTLASLPGSAKPKKMTTLEKSALDWKSHLQSESASGSSLTDELAANRRAGGYLEKVEFLKRVDERKDETLESLKSSKRRKL